MEFSSRGQVSGLEIEYIGFWGLEIDEEFNLGVIQVLVGKVKEWIKIRLKVKG